ncbi:MAG: tRNA (adenosine(37)-N6)-threonylcarbamoyltransferase complex transferase subunit TsaD [Candidatus Levybacteria bacterium]|nr:tRNA (adenosine(37)-N6)-threonylcarbamoyltransferase complex transferase subunit TsaD [Candidatus Levybacteria bacterium]
MRVLSIESSCDETSAAVVEKIGSNITVLSNVTATSLLTHAKTGGIIPENAAREQVKFIIPVITEALLASQNIQKSSNDHENYTSSQNVLKHKIDTIAVTYGPGLIGSLLVGVETAKTLSYVFNKPLIPVNHLLAHLFANFIDTTPPFPFIGLIVSGAHTDLLYFKNIHEYEWLGGTRDDAAGECFDKCARILGFDYPGGPKISELAQKGEAQNIQLPKLMKDNNFEFSFSGLKTAFANIVRQEFEVSKKPTQDGYSWTHAKIDNLSNAKEKLLYDLCASLENTIIEVIVRKTLKAAETYNCSTILIGGGVAANTKLTTELKSKKNIELFVPEKKYCTDNGAMVGAYALLNPAEKSWKEVTANPNLYFD